MVTNQLLLYDTCPIIVETGSPGFSINLQTTLKPEKYSYNVNFMS